MIAFPVQFSTAFSIETFTLILIAHPHQRVSPSLSFSYPPVALFKLLVLSHDACLTHDPWPTSIRYAYDPLFAYTRLDNVLSWPVLKLVGIGQTDFNLLTMSDKSIQSAMDAILEAVRDLPVTVIDPGGDATLVLSNRNCRLLFQCSSKELIRACGLFRKKAGPGWTSSPRAYTRTKGLPDHSRVRSNCHWIYTQPHCWIWRKGAERSVCSAKAAWTCQILRLPWLCAGREAFRENLDGENQGPCNGTLDSHTWEKLMGFISYAFRDEQLFRHTTAIAQQNLDRNLEGKKVLIPKDIVSKWA